MREGPQAKKCAEIQISGEGERFTWAPLQNVWNRVDGHLSSVLPITGRRPRKPRALASKCVQASTRFAFEALAEKWTDMAEAVEKEINQS